MRRDEERMEEKKREALRRLIAGVMPGRENALVFGEGPQNPRLMLIGEAPGEQESLQGRPFVGKAGKNLDHFLELAGLERSEIYITNVVKYRPTKTGATGRPNPGRNTSSTISPMPISRLNTIGRFSITVLNISFILSP